MDGVDASLIETDGESLIKIKGSLNVPYEESFKLELIENISNKKISSQTELKLTQFHADAVSKLIEKENLIKSQIDLIGFHGQTIHHDTDNQITIQMGDGDLLAKLCDIDVVNDFRSNDVLNGGQGAPLVPLFHQAIIGDLPKPFMILNVGGVANVSWVDEMDEVSAFDSGPGNALIDDFMYQRTGSRMDQNGNLALSGKVNSKVLNTLMENPFFEMKGPKSLDRNHFDSSPVFELSDADAVMTLCAFTAEAVRKSISHFQNSPSLCAVSGGGRKNKAIIRELEKRLETKISTTEEFGWEGDYLESQAFAYLAVRSVKVVNDFRSNDVLNGGQGAPLVPLFHQAIIGDLPKPFMILNVGGVANVSWVDEMDEVSAFDSGPGNALIDDFMYQRTGSRMDQNGNLALSGKVNSKVLNTLMENPFFEMKGPKSLDRNHFDSSPVFELSDADAVMTLCAFTAEAVRKSISHFQNSPSLCAVSGGGRKNKAIIRELEKRLETKISTTEEFGWEGDYLESQAFAYLAVRSAKGLPLSLPSTTGVSKPVSGGTLHPKGV